MNVMVETDCQQTKDCDCAIKEEEEDPLLPKHCYVYVIFRKFLLIEMLLTMQ